MACVITMQSEADTLDQPCGELKLWAVEVCMGLFAECWLEYSGFEFALILRMELGCFELG